MRVETNISESVDHLFRHNAGQMSAVLTRIFGFENIDLVEDAIQESMIRALNNWSIKGLPDNPGAWLIQAAKNYALDRLRRSSKSASLEDEARAVDDYAQKSATPGDVGFEKELGEDQLQMIFACCNPSITPDSQVSLTLKTVGGFGVGEIASAFLSNNAAVAKLLSRAKKRLRDEGVVLEIPEPSKLPARIDPVLKVLYLMFNEGYSATEGAEHIRRDLCHEAIRLVRLLTEHPQTSLPNVHALAALFLFQASRLPARSGKGGTLIVLPEQDRSLWDSSMIADGLRQFRLSAKGEEISDYHIEAEIASYHALAADFESTDWKAVLAAYDKLILRRPSPVLALNRVIALAEVDGVNPALSELADIRDGRLEAYYPFHITLAELLKRTGDTNGALRAYEFASGLTGNNAVRRYIEERISELSGIVPA